MTKKDEFDIAVNNVSWLCTQLEIAHPKIMLSSEIRHCGYYDFSKPDIIYIDLKKCDKTSKKNNPLMIHESTIYGTVMHEFGHYIQHMYYRDLQKRWKAIKTEPFIHYHERSVSEDIAECIRLMITYPDRLRAGRPKRYAILQPIFRLTSLTVPQEFIRLYNVDEEELDVADWEKFLV